MMLQHSQISACSVRVCVWEQTVELIVESLSRVNSGGAWEFIQQKGIAPIHHSAIELNNEEIQDLEIIAVIEFQLELVKGSITPSKFRFSVY
jgi:hypothetical protein